ncbi:Rrf2 family transcriptional regulator [Peribacillus kribbensis]|uniref:Rrf2 family transcriptional regulator n=1 Tax=Peribacillus kribbensis TaxID=356658 RepID=UPI000417740C|nr:Rrf2 family transcriptional regulator [Peribacillus kribbensis]
MRLTNYTDYSLRVLIYLASLEDGKLANIQEIADSYKISKNHLMKIIHNLGKKGYIYTIRGRNGGIKLAKTPAEINIGEVVRKTEDDFNIVNCFGDSPENHCILAPVCTLKNILGQALTAFIEVLDQYTLEDISHNPGMVFRMLRG